MQKRWTRHYKHKKVCDTDVAHQKTKQQRKLQNAGRKRHVRGNKTHAEKQPMRTEVPKREVQKREAKCRKMYRKMDVVERFLHSKFRFNQLDPAVGEPEGQWGEVTLPTSKTIIAMVISLNLGFTTVLDVGSGRGRTAFPFACLPHVRVFLVELSPCKCNHPSCPTPPFFVQPLFFSPSSCPH